MAARRTERLLNLVICLLHTRSYLTAERIRELVAGYDEAPSDEAYKRMFERDKEDLRDLGIPLETGTNSAFDDEPGYRIARRDYALPDVTLEPAEAAAVGLAARMWSSASMSAAATRALRKLEAAGVEVAPLPEGLQPQVEASGSAFPVLAEAVHDGRRVTFSYRTAGTPDPVERTVEPWGVVWWHGRWYLVGLQGDGRQLVVAASDPVAELVLVHVRVAARLERDAEVAQLFLVTLEHPPERLFAVGAVAGHGVADLLHGQVAAGVQQADDEVEQPLCLLRRHEERR